MERDCWEFDWEGDARRKDAAFYTVYEGWHVTVTGIEGAVGIYYADYEFRERCICVAGAFDESFAEEEREFRVAVVCQSAS